jgi:hypothetical protein
MRIFTEKGFFLSPVGGDRSIISLKRAFAARVMRPAPRGPRESANSRLKLFFTARYRPAARIPYLISGL